MKQLHFVLFSIKFGERGSLQKNTATSILWRFIKKFMQVPDEEESHKAYSSAMTSISTRASLGRRATSTAERAGYLPSVKNSA